MCSPTPIKYSGYGDPNSDSQAGRTLADRLMRERAAQQQAAHGWGTVNTETEGHQTFVRETRPAPQAAAAPAPTPAPAAGPKPGRALLGRQTSAGRGTKLTVKR